MCENEDGIAVTRPFFFTCLQFDAMLKFASKSTKLASKVDELASKSAKFASNAPKWGSLFHLLNR
ncbi:hypothetical protein [Peribacillus sp. SI8-4]|uniref:hypothetical protein n=1 Tax=Peribacillus sp. SI8-4 TaxID=3048009 RepID=UPI002554C910|nr:hypothetical protein [Peribacillus sp. SI8-4]